jgi:hypothetical protein
MNTNWDLLKIKYEIYGASLPTLAQEFSLPEEIIAGFVKDKNLSRKTAISIMQSPSGKETISSIKSEIGIETLLKRKYLAPTYVELETLIIQKTKSILNSIIPEDPNAANKLAKIASIVKTMSQVDTETESDISILKNYLPRIEKANSPNDDYKPAYAQIAYTTLAREPLMSKAHVCEALNISFEQLEEWIDAHSEFKQAINRGLMAGEVLFRDQLSSLSFKNAAKANTPLLKLLAKDVYNIADVPDNKENDILETKPHMISIEDGRINSECSAGDLSSDDTEV